MIGAGHGGSGEGIDREGMCAKVIYHTPPIPARDGFFQSALRSPLYIASWKGHIAVVRALLDRGADVDVGRVSALLKPRPKPFFFLFSA